MKELEKHFAEKKSSLFITQPSWKEDKHSLGREIELGVRQEGIEKLKSNYSALKNVCPQEQ